MGRNGTVNLEKYLSFNATYIFMPRKRIEIVKIDGIEYFKLDGRKRLFTKSEIRNSEVRHDKLEKKLKKRKKRKRK